MAILLGVDTGGTYTDAVLMEDEKRLVAKAKALTTRHNLAIGIGAAVAAVLAESDLAPADISMTALSTTLATNALVEGQGGRVALISIGFSEADLKRQDLDKSLGGDPVLRIAGGHSHAGQEATPLDIAALRAGIEKVDAGVSGYAVAGQFATRNAAHEIAVRDEVLRLTGKPVSCSHELSAKLNGPKRAMTALLNARLIGMIAHLITATESLFAELGITAPLKVVRGDGALISADMARETPIETILSGPAASIVGARWLTGAPSALVSDIGGTTTDIALLIDGKPRIDPLGARVGGFRTMVEAVAMHTSGLGGDSEVRLQEAGLSGGLVLGPRRRIPVSLCALDWPDMVHGTLDAQINGERLGEHDGRFIVPLVGAGRSSEGLPDRDLRLLDKIGDAAWPLGKLVSSRTDLSALDRLAQRGLLIEAGITPSDASHVLGLQTGWDRSAAEKALRLMARQKTPGGLRLAESATHLAGMITDQLVAQTNEALLTVGFSEDSGDWEGEAANALARHVLTRRGLGHHRDVLSIDAGLNLPVVGLGASAGCYYGAVGDRLSTRMILPEHGDVANAIGAVVGRISIRRQGTVTSPSEGRFRAHLEAGPMDFTDEAAALDHLETELSALAVTQARAAGADDVRVELLRDIRRSQVEGNEVFIEATISATASGRPRVAHEG